MPSSHRRYAGWTVERITRDAAAIGPAVTALCALILERRPHPEQGFGACLGILARRGDIMRSLDIAGTGMQAQQTNVGVVSINIANMTATGFKRRRAEFRV